MADDKSKRTIPEWQRASTQTPKPEETDDGLKVVEGTGTPPTSDTSTAEESENATSSEQAATAEESTSPTDAASASQLENMRTFLEDPAVKNASTQKKRAFFESKGIPSDLIDQALTEDTTFNASDFESFKQTEAQSLQPAQPPPPPAQQTFTAPPIITYPEFLVEAHKPSPLVTPGRIINTAYIAGTIYALLYGASKYLVTPMAMSLADSRHDFSSHSQTKLDEMNERLEKLVSKIPEPKKEKPSPDPEADSDDSSDVSDPTELYHRDMGTQTSRPPSPQPATSPSIPGLETASEKKDSLTHATNTLSILHSHLDEMLSRSENLENTNRSRQESMSNLRKYLDDLMFPSHSGAGGFGMWTPDGETEQKGKAEEDVIEVVKKEIRGVKGVLLSAKRFPGVGGRAGG